MARAGDARQTVIDREAPEREVMATMPYMVTPVEEAMARAENDEQK